MNMKVSIVAGEILLLLEENNRPMSLKEVRYYLEASMRVINLSVSRLLREGLIRIETRNNKNFISGKFDKKEVNTYGMVSEATENLYGFGGKLAPFGDRKANSRFKNDRRHGRLSRRVYA